MDKKDKIAEHIKQFCEHRNEQVILISEIEADGDTTKYQKLLYSSLIDSLSRIVYPHKGSRDRFVEFVKNFGLWDDGENISIPHLVKLTRLNPEPEFKELRMAASKLLNDWKPGEVIKLHRDMKYKKAISLISKEKSQSIFNNITLKHIQHYNLLYVYRNSLIHEFRTPSSDFDFNHLELPAYIHLISVKSEVRTEEYWNLCYPVKFYIWLISNCLKTLSNYLSESELDPYEYYTTGEYWIESFNQ